MFVCPYISVYNTMYTCYSIFLGLQVVLVSATLPAEVLEMTSKFMTDPMRILVKR